MSDLCCYFLLALRLYAKMFGCVLSILASVVLKYFTINKPWCLAFLPSHFIIKKLPTALYVHISQLLQHS